MRKYFYKTSTGDLKQYIYCIRGCEKPYMQEDVNLTIFKISDTSFMCSECTKYLQIKNKSHEDKEEIIAFKEEAINLKEETEEIENIEEIVETEEIIENLEKQIEKVEKETIRQETIEQEKIIVFVVQCSDQTYYCGITENLTKAIKCHNAGNCSNYTKVRRPVQLVTSKEVNSQEDAKKIKAELQTEYNINK